MSGLCNRSAASYRYLRGWPSALGAETRGLPAFSAAGEETGWRAIEVRVYTRASTFRLARLRIPRSSGSDPVGLLVIPVAQQKPLAPPDGQLGPYEGMQVFANLW